MLLLPFLIIKKDIRTAITHHRQAESFFFFHDSEKSDANNILLPREQARSSDLREEEAEKEKVGLPSENL